MSERRRGHLLRAIPALVALAMACVVGWMGLSVDKDALGEKYLDLARLAIDEEDLGRAELCFERVVELDGDRLSVRFELAEAWVANTETRLRGVEAMKALAPEDQTGYAPAHFWLGIARLPGIRSKRINLSCERHLLRALKEGVERVRCNLALVEVYLARGDLIRAQPHVQASRAVGALPQSRMLIFFAVWLRAMKKDGEQKRALQAQATKLAKEILDKADAILKEQPFDNGALSRAVLALRFLGERKEIIARLEPLIAEGGERAKRFGPVLAQEYYEEAKSLPEAAVTRRVELYAKTCKLQPLSTPALRELVPLAEGGNARARGVLAAYTRPDAGAQLHATVGTAMLLAGRVDQAALYLEKAHEGMGEKKSAGVMNNLAYALKDKAEPEYDRALALIDELLRTQKTRRFHDTRGRILLAMGRAQDALESLELDLSGVADRRGSLEAIAQAYDQLGSKSLAATYRRRAQEASATPYDATARSIDVGLDPRLLAKD